MNNPWTPTGPRSSNIPFAMIHQVIRNLNSDTRWTLTDGLMAGYYGWNGSTCKYDDELEAFIFKINVSPEMETRHPDLKGIETLWIVTKKGAVEP